MSQKDRAIAFMKPLFLALQKFDVEELRNIVEEAQNKQEYGGQADGSMTEGQWLKAREVTKLLDELKQALAKSPEKHLKRALRIGYTSPPDDTCF